MPGDFRTREERRLAGADGAHHVVEVLTEPSAAILHRKSGRQVTVDGHHVAWAADETQLEAILGAVERALDSGWTPKSGPLPDDK